MTSDNIIKSNWVFKVKAKANGTIEQYKAHFIANGMLQIEGADYHETFNPIVKPISIHVMLTIAVTYGGSCVKSMSPTSTSMGA